MFMHHWSIGMARGYALQALEEEIRRQYGLPRTEPRRRLRKGLASALRGTGRVLSTLGERLATGRSEEPRPLSCG